MEFQWVISMYNYLHTQSFVFLIEILALGSLLQDSRREAYVRKSTHTFCSHFDRPIAMTNVRK